MIGLKNIVDWLLIDFNFIVNNLCIIQLIRQIIQIIIIYYNILLYIIIYVL